MPGNNLYFLIRKAKEEDFNEIKRLEYQCFTSDAFDDDLLWQMLNETFDFLTWVAELTVKNALVGYVSLYLDSEDECTIVSICVDPLHRQQGVGTALLNTVFRFATAHNVRRMLLTVAVSNDAAMKLYKKMGFSIKGIIPRYYSSGEDAYVMTKEFIPEVKA